MNGERIRKMNFKVYPKCRYQYRECFAYLTGCCKILSSMPNQKICPFYKTKEQAIKDKIELERKMKEHGTDAMYY